jgi:hypothetical protein
MFWAPVAQRIEHLTTDQKVRGSSPLGRASSKQTVYKRCDLSLFLVRFILNFRQSTSSF